MDYTQCIGDINELQCMSSFIKLGYECSVPFGNSAKYDFIVDIDGKLLRIQCKSSRYVPDKKGGVLTNAFCFNTSCTTTNSKKINTHLYNASQIDFFATHFLGNTYVIPVTMCKSHTKTLRLSPPENGCNTYIKAEDYLITNMFSESIHLQQSKDKYMNRMKNI